RGTRSLHRVATRATPDARHAGLPWRAPPSWSPGRLSFISSVLSAPAFAAPTLDACPAGSSVVLVHGTRTSSAICAGQVEALSHAGHRGITLDLPGHGDRAGERFTLRGAMRAIDDAVTGCPEPPVLVGLSLGGYLALAYAARHHGAVAGVVLSGCS